MTPPIEGNGTYIFEYYSGNASAYCIIRKIWRNDSFFLLMSGRVSETRVRVNGFLCPVSGRARKKCLERFTACARLEVGLGLAILTAASEVGQSFML
jgi:hypothetical protein